MSNLIEQRVELARQGRNPAVICAMKSGWLVIGDIQPLAGYCLLLADPVVESLNDLGTAERARYCADMIRIGDALLAVTKAYRINYETLANAEPSLHTHIIPRYASEPDALRRDLAFRAYDWKTARKFDAVVDGPFMAAMRRWLDASPD